MTLDSEESLRACIKQGVYSTKFSKVPNYWMVHHEGVFADYFSMKADDNIYFFIKRKIYGIGKLVNIQKDCKYLNYIDADLPQELDENGYLEKQPLLPDMTNKNRCFCIFCPSPFFFKKGVDMDEVLNSNPESFKMLRVLWKLSFIKIDDIENQALLDILLKRNELNIFSGEAVFPYNSKLYRQLCKRTLSSYRLRHSRVLAECASGDFVKHEMALEAALCDVLGRANTTPIGRWDYVSHQVVASPFKPVDYMDKMDIFGYRYITGYKTISKYLVVELKRGIAAADVIEQIMKYVDWIKSEYAHGDYSMIEAYIIAVDFPEDVVLKRNEECIRYFTKGFRPTESCRWQGVQLIKYKYENGLVFELV